LGAEHRGGSRSPPAPAPGLAALQAAIYELITAPQGVASRLLEREREGDAWNLEAMVRPGARMSAVERLDVYANMYFYRILDVLRDEFARTLAVVGDPAFHNLITDYLLDCRPAHPSLREVGARLPGYVAQHPLALSRPWLAELAHLERAHLELFDGPDAKVLTLERIRQLAPESLPELTLCAIPCHAIQHNLFRTSTAWTALEVSPSAAAAPASQPETLVIWRQELAVHHRLADADEAPLLPLLQPPGSAFALVCERLVTGVDASQATERAFALVGRWIIDGLVIDPTAGP
jgi:hypothetical protein